MHRRCRQSGEIIILAKPAEYISSNNNYVVAWRKFDSICWATYSDELVVIIYKHVMSSSYNWQL